MVAMARDGVRIRLLGPVELVADGHALGGPKQRLLLAVLAVRAGEVTSTGALIDVLWSDQLPDGPQRSLQVHVSKLRRVLDAAGLDASIEHHGGGYVLRIAPDVIDVRRFEELVEEGTELVGHDPGQARELLRDALALWHGRPFGELGDHPALRGEVARLEDLELRALEARIDADLATGRHDSVVGELHRLTDERPLRESPWGQLMVALYRSGRQGDALEAYDRARRTLSDELGVDPSRALQELQRRILRHDPTLDAPEIRASPPHAAVRPPAEPRSLAILPFEVMGSSPDAAFLAVGLHNDLLTELSKVAELTVISRTSVLGYRGTDKPMPVIARELNVGTIVEGTVQSSGQRFRLTVQLIDGVHDVHRWAESYDDQLTTENLFAIQSDLARGIAASLSAELVPSRGRAAEEGRQTDSLEAYRFTAAARQQFDLKTAAGFRRAIECYEEAVRLDPGYADAWVGLADALVSMDAYGHGDRHELLPRAEKAVHRALALDTDSAQARTSLGVLHTAYQDGPAAIGELQRAIRIRPGHGDAHNWHSWVSLLTGCAEPGLVSAARTVELDPRSAEAHAHLALAYAATGQPGEGLLAARQARRLSPYTTADLYEGLCLYELERYEDARKALEPLTAGPHGGLGVPWAGRGPDAVLALSLIGLGERAEARAVLDDIDRDDFPFAAGLVHLALGELDAATTAFDRLERMTAWPCLAFHHYHRGVWSRIAGSDQYRALLRTARRSWNVEPSHGP